MLDAITSKQASSHQAQVIAGLLEVSTKLDAFMSPPAYATRGLKEQEKKELDQKVINPALTLLGTCTPDVYNQITAQMLTDGFLNRFVIAISDQKINYLSFKENQAVPESIKDWIAKIDSRVSSASGRENIASEQPRLETINFTDEATAVIQAYERKMTDMMNEDLADSPLNDMLPRSAEMAMRLSLIHALSENPDAEYIYKESAEWARDFIWYCLEGCLKHFKRNLADSPHEKKRMDYLKKLRDAGSDGVKVSDLAKKKPFSADNKRLRDELIQDLIDAGHAAKGVRDTGKRGRQAQIVYAINEDE